MVVGIVLLLSCGSVFAGCSKDKGGDNTEQFGQFTYLGRKLVEYAVEDISSSDVKDKLVNLNINIGAKASSADIYEGEINPPTPSEQLVIDLKYKYSNCDVTIKYYTVDSDDQQSKTSVLGGDDYDDTLRKNEYRVTNQIIVKNLILYSDLIDYMEEENEAFEERLKQGTEKSPYNCVFSWHLSKNKELVIKQHDFVEISSAVRGGVSCSYLQDIEMVYDEEYKIKKWQTSLGIYTETPNDGTVKQGYIMEIDFNWNSRFGETK